MDHRPAHLCPPGRQILVHHDYVDWPPDAADSVAQANSLGDTILDITLNNQEVQIAVARELPACSRPKQDHTRRRPGSLHKPLPGQLDRRLREEIAERCWGSSPESEWLDRRSPQSQD